MTRTADVIAVEAGFWTRDAWEMAFIDEQFQLCKRTKYPESHARFQADLCMLAIGEIDKFVTHNT